MKNVNNMMHLFCNVYRCIIILIKYSFKLAELLSHVKCLIRLYNLTIH